MSLVHEAQGCNNNRIYDNKSDHMAYPGLCVLPMQLPSQSGLDICTEDGCVQHSASRDGGSSIPSQSFEFSDMLCNASRQEGYCAGFPDLARSASKESFSRESSRSSFWSSYSSTLSVVSEDKPWDSSTCDDQFQDDRSSLSSLSSSEESSYCSGDEISESQISRKGPLSNMYSLKEALPCKKGLSGFFIGKSRSFSCLADVTSVEDLAKPDNPYSKKRKYLPASSGSDDKLLSLSIRTGAAGLSRKTSHNRKLTSVISGASIVKGRCGEGQFDCPSRMAKTPRSYSLSDLHGTGSYFTHE